MKVKVLITSLVLVSQVLTAQHSFDQLKDAFTKSYELEAQGNYKQAAEVLSKVYLSNHYGINLRLGWLFYMDGKFAISKQYYQRATELRPMSIEAYLGLVFPVSALGNWDEVLAIYQKILNIDPNHSLTNYRIGTLYYYREDYRLAEQHLEKVVNMYPFDYDSLLMLGWTKYQLGKREEAAQLFRQALLNRPYDESAQQGLELSTQ